MYKSVSNSHLIGGSKVGSMNEHPFLIQFFFICMQFLGQIWPNNRLEIPTFGVAAPHLGNLGFATATSSYYETFKSVRNQHFIELFSASAKISLFSLVTSSLFLYQQKLSLPFVLYAWQCSQTRRSPADSVGKQAGKTSRFGCGDNLIACQSASS